MYQNQCSPSYYNHIPVNYNCLIQDSYNTEKVNFHNDIVLKKSQELPEQINPETEGTLVVARRRGKGDEKMCTTT